MKWLGRLAALTVIGFGLWQGALFLARYDLMAFFSHDREPWKLEMLPQANIAVAYIAETQSQLSFPIPNNASRIRIVSNANLRDLPAARAARTADPLRRWHYALEIELVDSTGRTLLKRVHHHRTDFVEIREPANRVITPAYYLNEKLTPATGVVLNLDLAGVRDAARLRIRAISADPEIADVVIRSYAPEPNNERQVALLWQRLNDKQKSLLAKGSVYDSELLIEEERRNLIRNLWQPMGPLGAQGVDFRARELYVLRDIDGEPAEEPIPPAGIISTPGQFAVFPIPEQGAAVHFTAQALPGIELPDEVRIRGRWYGNTTFARDNFVLLWKDRSTPMDKNFSGGLVELEAPFPMALRAFIDGAKTTDGKTQRIEITPDRLYQRLFLADRQRPVTFAIEHESTLATPIQLTARQLLPVDACYRLTRLHYEFLAANGKTIKSGELALNEQPARYDQIVSEPVGTLVADFTETFFSVPRDVAALRISSPEGIAQTSQEVLVGLLTRPASLPRKTKAPEDQFAYGAKGIKVPAWFAVRPLDYERLIAINRSRLIVVQSRPPDDKPEIQAGLYDWQDFRPMGNWLVRQLLVPRDPNLPLREEALVTTFTPLAANSRQRLNFPPYLGVRQLTPTLIWVNREDSRFSATVSLDGRVLHQFKGGGHYGATRLPPVPSGQHQIDIETSSATDSKAPQFFMNQITAVRQAYSTHLAARIDPDHSLSFDIERTSHKEETVTARLFQPADKKGRTLLRARIQGPLPPQLTPLPGWIFKERLFDVRPDPSFAAPVFDTEGVRSDAGRPAYILFPIDAPLGHYRIHFTIEQGPPGYLTVSRLTPGVVPQRRLLDEPEARHVDIE